MNSGSRCTVTPGFCILWALLLLVLPLGLLTAAAAAAVFHELCHALAVRLTGGRILGLTIGAGGMEMETTPMTPWQELLCALAGPLGSFLLAALLPWMPRLGLCGFVQGCFNLLPLYPLDGGRALARGLEMVFPGHWQRIMNWIEWGMLVLLLVVAACLGPGCIGVWGMLAMRKIPCKERRFGVQ